MISSSYTRNARGSTVDALGSYLAEIGAHGLLTAEEEVELAQAIEAGAEAQQRLEAGEKLSTAERRRLDRAIREAASARNRFVQSNLRLVVANARRYAGRDIEMLDLIQEGNLGLITAVEKFDWRKGFKFSTYATWWIRQAMQRARANLVGSMRVPTKLFDLLPVVREAAESLQSKLERAPSMEEISSETGVAIDDVERVLTVSSTIPLETPVGEDGASLVDFIADVTAPEPDLEVEQRLGETVLRQGLADLPGPQRRAIELRFGLNDEPPATMARISSELGLPVHQLSRLLDEALKELAGKLSRYEEMLAA